MQKAPENDILERLHESLASLASAFSIVTGVHCRVCIKEVFCPDIEVEPKKRALRVRTVVRSLSTEDEATETESDWVDKNTDFEMIFTQPKKATCNCFFSNNLSTVKNYQNSHWTQEVWDKNDFPYISAIVWPIRKLLTAPVDGTLHQEHDCLGFLCVDSKARNAFRKRFDFSVGAGYADTLYALLKTYRDQRPATAGELEKK